MSKLESKPHHQSVVRCYRQGDVLIRSIEELPKQKRRIRSQTHFVLAEGEATGHAHTLEAIEGLDVYARGNQVSWLEINNGPAVLRHQEHSPITIQPGLYEVVIQREFAPARFEEVEENRSWRYVYD